MEDAFAPGPGDGGAGLFKGGPRLFQVPACDGLVAELDLIAEKSPNRFMMNGDFYCLTSPFFRRFDMRQFKYPLILLGLY